MDKEIKEKIRKSLKGRKFPNRRKQKVICWKCNNEFIAVRSDARTCKECNKKRINKWRKKPENIKRKNERYKILRKAVIDGYGGSCKCCGESKIEFLAIDHVCGGGGKERKIMSIQQIMKKIINNDFPNEYRILCHNCNLSLGFYGYCPHKKGGI